MQLDIRFKFCVFDSIWIWTGHNSKAFGLSGRYCADSNQRLKMDGYLKVINVSCSYVWTVINVSCSYVWTVINVSCSYVWTVHKVKVYK